MPELTGPRSEPWQGLHAPVHRAGRADGLGPQSATCSPGFRDDPRFALVARVFPGAAPCRSETLPLALHAPRWRPEVGIGGVASLHFERKRKEKKSERLERTNSGIRKVHSAVVPFEGTRRGAVFPDFAPRRCDGLVSGYPQPGSVFHRLRAWSPPPVTSVARKEWWLSRELALRLVVDHQLGTRI